MQKWRSLMFSKKSFPIILLVVFGCFGALYAFNLNNTEDPSSKYERILQTVGDFLEEGHYSPKKIDDGFSLEVFNKFIKDLDEDKKYFLEGDIQELTNQYGSRIDDEIHGAKLESFFAISKIYQQRLAETSTIFKEVLSKPFDFSKPETVNLDYDHMDYPKSEADRYDRWRRYLKYLTLERFVDLQETRDKNKDKDSTVDQPDSVLEARARQAIYKIMDRNLTRLKLETTQDDQFDMFVNAITNTMDPHTDFFPPVERRSFDEAMSGEFFGIGASLVEDDDGNIKIQSLVPGSAAWKSGKVAVGDIILKVAQGDDSAVDLSGYAREDAVKLIRGTKGTVVKLTLKKVDGSIKVVPLVRDKIVLEETFAKSAIINEGDKRIGYIELPEFYANFDQPNGARCAVDVAREVAKLKDDKVDGIIIDLRNNGGGSLYDVVRMVGLFINNGPVVQVRGRGEPPSVLKDPDSGILYSGPLAVMVNENSASASEIFAAAIQDYHRGLIIGSSTYGKGTVQRELQLDPRITGTWPKDSAVDLGSLKLTLQKFYRISGGSTQLKGVVPDVAIPDELEYLKQRERDNPDALQWDEISKADFQPWQPRYDVDQVRRESAEHIAQNPTFRDILRDAKWLADQNDKQYSLQLGEYKKEREDMNKTYSQIDKEQKLADPLTMQIVDALSDSTQTTDVTNTARNTQWLNFYKSDLGLGEAVHVMADMIKDGNLNSNQSVNQSVVKAGTGRQQ